MDKNLLAVNYLAQSSTLPGDNEAVLDQGRRLVHAVESRTGWLSVRCNDTGLSTCSGQKLVFREPPPQIPTTRLETLKADNAGQKQQNDLFRSDVSKLKPFESVGFRHLLKRSLHTGKHCARQQMARKRPREALDDEQEPDGRKRAKVDHDYLYDLVALPHYHPNLTVATDPSMNISERFPRSFKVPWTPIPPYSIAKIEELLLDDYARLAWIIPISGATPWANTTAAVLTDDENDMPGTASEPPMSQIKWSPKIVKNFWEDFLKIRSRGFLGSIALSYSIPTSSSGRTSSRPLSLSSCAYIKLYHGARYSLYIRKTLDAWRPPMPPRNATSPEVPASARSAADLAKGEQARPLLGAKLMLLDEVSQPIGFC